MKPGTKVLITTSLASVFTLLLPLAAQELHPKKNAEAIIAASGVQGGLIVHLNCGDGKLTAALQVNDNYLVHGLDDAADNVRQAREYLHSAGIYGKVAIAQLDGTLLPYADNLVNLVVAEKIGDIPHQEVIRVLCPGGVALIRGESGTGKSVTLGGETWSRIVKPRPKNIDEWTHYNHDPSGNAVAHDEVIGPPRRLQWTADPPYTRSHEHTPSINAVVSTGGRIFYIADHGSIGNLLAPPKWELIARDAFNGIQLWKRPLAAWYPHIVNWGQTPLQLQHKLVAVGNRVYVTLGLHAPLSMLDAATGQTLKVYENTRGTEEILCHQGILLLMVRKVTNERTLELAKMGQLSLTKDSPLYERDSAQPLVSRFRKIESKGEKSILALDAATGRQLWKKTGADVNGLRTLSLRADGDNVLYQNGKNVICLDLRTGKPRWSESTLPLRLTYANSVICADNRSITSLSMQTGKARWKQPNLVTQIRDVFVAGGTLWIGGFKPIKGKRGPSWGPYFATQRDLKTGKMLKHIEPENPGHHHRCYSNKATDRYILGGRRGTEFIDLATGDVQWNSFARGVCRYGIMPANGLLYAPPHPCACYVAVKLQGFNALAPISTQKSTENSESLQVIRGPAYGQIKNQQSTTDDQHNWPAYRHDAQRSAFTRAFVPANLQQKWQKTIGGKLTPPTVANGKVYVSSVEAHQVLAFDVNTGQNRWSFTTDARVDSPPTLYQDRAIFGCRDGKVYSLRATDGALDWRVQVASGERYIVASGQLESVTPIHGSVLIQDGVAYFTSGRSSYLDGGITLYRVQLDTGKLLSQTPIYSPDPQAGRQPTQYSPNAMPGARTDILTSDDKHVYLRDMVFDRNGNRQSESQPHLFALTGFLDDAWAHRSYWIFGAKCSISTGCSGRDRNLIYGRLLTMDDSTIYGYGRANVHWSNQLQDGAYRLFARKQNEKKSHWTKTINTQPRTIVLADKILFVAGSIRNAKNPWNEIDKSQPALLQAYDASSGAVLAQYRLESAPIFNGMAASANRLYLSLENGNLVCLEGNNQQPSDPI